MNLAAKKLLKTTTTSSVNVRGGVRNNRKHRRSSLPSQMVSQCEDKTLFQCDWNGDPELLRKRISARVDWGPFDVSLVQEGDDRLPTLSVRYLGPARERYVLMRSFWMQVENVAPVALLSKA